MQPVPMSGQSGMPQTAIWSIADAIMSHTYGDEISKSDWMDDDEEDAGDIADWDEWNTPRYDVERFYQRSGGSGATESVRWLRATIREELKSSQKVHMRTRRGKFPMAEERQERYLEVMRRDDERMLRRFIRSMIEANAISTGGGAGVQTGQVRGVVTPLGTGPKHPRKADKRGAKKRTKKRLNVGAKAFGGGEDDD